MVDFGMPEGRLGSKTEPKWSQGREKNDKKINQILNSVFESLRHHFWLFLETSEPRKSCWRVEQSTIFKKSVFSFSEANFVDFSMGFEKKAYLEFLEFFEFRGNWKTLVILEHNVNCISES